MAHLLRLIALFALWCVGGDALASIPQITGYRLASATTVNIYPSKAEACTVAEMTYSVKASYGASATVTSAAVILVGSTEFCRAIFSQNGGNYYSDNVGFHSFAGQCPANSTVSGSACTCTSPYVENTAHTACVAPPDPCLALAGKETGLKVWNGTASSFTFCDGWNPVGGGKCVVTALKDLSWQTSPTSGVWLSQGTGTYTGSSASNCTGDGGTGDSPAPSSPTPDGTPPQTPEPGTAAPAPCPAGQLPGVFNGNAICAPRGPDIPVEGTDGKEVKNPDGSITRTDGTTRCLNGKCETDTRVCRSASEGAAETCETTTSTESQAGFCDSNKGAKVCEGQGEGTPTSFGGTCAAGFKAVSDDAVINAMAAEIYRQNCKVNPDDAETTLAKTERVKTGDQTKDNPNNSSFSIAPGSIDTSDALGGAASCIPDKSITVMGYQTVVIPFSTWCNGFPLLGNLLLAVSFLLAGVIILRR